MTKQSNTTNKRGTRTMVMLSDVGQANLDTVCYLSGQKTKIGAIEAALGFYVAFLRGGVEHVHTCKGNTGKETWVKLGDSCLYCGWKPGRPERSEAASHEEEIPYDNASEDI